MQEASRRRNESIVGAWTKKPTGYTAQIMDQYRGAYNSINDSVRNAYVTTLSGVNPENYYDELLKYNRYRALQASINRDYATAARRAGKIQFQAGETALGNMYYENMYAVNWFSDKPYFGIINQKVIDVSVYGTPEVWESIKASNRARYSPYLPQYGTLSELLEANAANDLKKINQALTQGLRSGASYQDVSRDMRRIFNTTAANALRIARTEGNRNLNSGAFANTQRAVAAGINLERMYIATLDDRTREQSGDMDGQIRRADKPFEYGGLSWFIPGNSGNPAYDINDRCTTVDMVDGKPPTLRRGRNPATGENEVASFRSFDDWMKENDLKRNASGKIVQS